MKKIVFTKKKFELLLHKSGNITKVFISSRTMTGISKTYLKKAKHENVFVNFRLNIVAHVGRSVTLASERPSQDQGQCQPQPAVTIDSKHLRFRLNGAQSSFLLMTHILREPSAHNPLIKTSVLQ